MRKRLSKAILRHQSMWLEIEEAVMRFTTPITGFRLARVVQGIMGQHDVNPRSIPLHVIGRQLEANFEDHCKWRFDGVVEEACAAWHAVVLPEPWDAVGWAIQRMRWLPAPKQVPGKWYTKAKARNLTTTWAIFALLPEDENGLKFCACRTLAKHLGVDKETAGQYLQCLEKADLLERVDLDSQTLADRFRVLRYPYRCLTEEKIKT